MSVAHRLRRIRIWPDPVLTSRSDEVDEPANPIVREANESLVADMVATMRHLRGVGLAAPQIGVGQRIVVLEVDGQEPFALVDPVITNLSAALSTEPEGCLSLPTESVPVPRAVHVFVEWTDIDGAKRAELFEGLKARAIQHEIDHLDGKCIADYCQPVRKSMIRAKMNKLRRDVDRRMRAATRASAVT